MLYRLATPKFCSTLTITKENSLDFPLGFAVQKNSKWKYLVSESLHDLEDRGILREIINKWFFLPSCLQNSAQAYKFPWEYIGGMALAVGVFVIVSIVIVCIETIHTRRKLKKGVISTGSSRWSEMVVNTFRERMSTASPQESYVGSEASEQ